jgi:hypothetical protein
VKEELTRGNSQFPVLKDLELRSRPLVLSAALVPLEIVAAERLFGEDA